MARMTLRQFVSHYRWPMMVVGILAMSITAQGVLVFVATRPDAPRPIADYYKRSLAWDADADVIAHSRALGWQVAIDVPAGAEYAVAALRPVDIAVTDKAGAPVSGLSGRLITVRPADDATGGASALTELPHAPGHYRTLARLGAPGLWELNLDAALGQSRFVYTARVDIRADLPGGGVAP